MSIHITSTGVCRASEKVFERLHVEGLSPELSVSPLPPASGPQDTQELPCSLYELDRDAESQDLVAVYPIPTLPQARLSLGVWSSAGKLVHSEARDVDFESIKWQSRINYRLHKNLCAAIRNYDDAHSPLGVARIAAKRVIPCDTHIIVRGEVRLPHLGKHDMQLRFLDDSLSPIGEKLVSMGSSVVPTRVTPSLKELSYQFSVHLPWNLERIHLLAWDAAHPWHVCSHILMRETYEAMVRETDQLFLHAGADPYYPAWLASHRATSYELEEERRLRLPITPKFSIIVPLYKTPESFFVEMLDSVTAQTYPNWELILVNASPEETRLCELVEQACQQDARVKEVRLEENGGISLNTNAGIRRAQGDFVCFFDHDDVLEPDLFFEYAKALNQHPDIDLLYCDEDKLNPRGEFCAPYFKPDFNIDLLRDNNYICHLLAIRKSLLDILEPNTPEFDGAQDHNLTLQAVEHARRVHHVPRVLYHWRISETSTAANADSKPYANEAGIKAVSAHLRRLGIEATVELARFPFMYAVHYLPPKDLPLVSIIIPTRDHADVLEHCVESILEKTTYQNYEILLVDNRSEEPETDEYYRRVLQEHPERVRLEHWDEAFNFSKIINHGVRCAKGDYLLLLNNDTEVITPEWVDRMLGICAREDVGACGVRLYYPDDTIQHAGIVVTDKDAGHFAQDMPRGNNWGYFNLADCQRDLSAVTGACMMTKRSAFEAVGGFEERLSVAFNDVDFCLKLREQNLLVVYTPEVELYHFESLSRGTDLTEEQLVRNHQERAYLYQRWVSHYVKSDPYYTPNLRETIELARYYHF